MTSLSFIHLTDLHLVAPGEVLYGLDPAVRLQAAVESIISRHGPGCAAPAEFAVITGDLAHLGEVAAYEALKEILRPLPFPCHLLLGNHDDRGAFLSGEGTMQMAMENMAQACAMGCQGMP